jgi:hypothetical protein
MTNFSFLNFGGKILRCETGELSIVNMTEEKINETTEMDNPTSKSLEDIKKASLVSLTDEETETYATLPYLIIESLKPVKQADGSIKQELILKLVQGDNSLTDFDSVLVLYRFLPVFPHSDSEVPWFFVKIDPKDPIVTLSSGSLVKAEFRAKVFWKERFYYGEGSLLIYGRGKGEIKGPGITAEKNIYEDWPFFSLSSPSIIVRTGEELQIDVEEIHFNSTSKNLWYIDDNLKQFVVLKPTLDGSYRHILDLDHNLANLGFTATKSVYFIKALPDYGTACLTLWAVRSDTYGFSRSKGLTVLLISTVVGICLGQRFFVKKMKGH